MSDSETTILGEDLSKPSDETVTETPESFVEAQTEQEADYLASLVGEGKKYKTVEEAAKALAKKAVHADQFIETLKTEKQTLEEQISGAKKVEDILALLRQDPEPAAQYQEQTTQETPKASEQAEDVRTAVERLLKEKEEAARTEAEVKKVKENQGKSWEMLASAYGSLDAAKAIVGEYIGGDSVKADVVNKLGSYNPDELVKFMKAQKSAPVANTSNPSRLNLGEFDQSGGKMTWDFAQKVKKENPKLYHSHSFQRRMLKELPQL